MASPVEQVTVWWRYAFAATVARTADAGAGVGVLLPAAAGSGGLRLGGLLAAALTAPHLLGTRIGRLVDRARDPRRPLAAAASATPRRSRWRPARSGSTCPRSGVARWWSRARADRCSPAASAR